MCFFILIILLGAPLTVLSVLRWFEQTTEAVDNGWWNKALVLTLCPPAVWLFRSQIAAGRPSPVPHHEPVRGFGSAAIGPKTPPPSPTDQPPPGTPKEFLEKPKIPPPKPRGAKSAIDPDKMEKLRQKMKDQGML